VRRFLKLIIGLLLLPVCFGAASAVWRIFSAAGRADTIWVPLISGAVCWGVVYLLLPRPMWAYVAGHELTHVLWTWLFGGKVQKLKVSSKGGHVIVSKSNFLIALAPYFFPFYAAVVMLLFGLLRLAFLRMELDLVFLLLLGAAYAFHLTLTGHVLKTRQSDITEHGLLFSATIIFLGNVLVLLIAIPLLTSTPSVSTALVWCWEDTLAFLHSIRDWFQ